MYAWGRAGVSLPHSSRMQQGSGQRVSLSALQPGDLVFYGFPVHHVALYVGGGQVIHAPQAGDVVRYASVSMMSPVGNRTGLQAQPRGARRRCAGTPQHLDRPARPPAAGDARRSIPAGIRTARVRYAF